MISPKTTVSAAALLLVSAGAATAFPATATTSLNVRSGPGTGYSIVDQLQPGETVEVTARSGGWYQIDGQGWASGNYLDAEGGATVGYAEPRYGYDYGPAAFYYDDYPYYWDNAGFYFYIRDGRRHRVGWDWFHRHNHRDFRWSSNRYRGDFERRWQRQARGEFDGRRRGGDDDGGRLTRRERLDELQSGRSSSIEAEGRVRGGAEIGRGGGEARGEGNLRAGGERRSGQFPPRLEEQIPGGGY